MKIIMMRRFCKSVSERLSLRNRHVRDSSDALFRQLPTLAHRLIPRHSSLALMVLIIGVCNGCVTRTFHSSESRNRRDCDDVHCLPQLYSQEPPGAAVSTTHRCVEPLPRDAVPIPAGGYVQHWRDEMVAGAQQRHWFISRNEWFNGSSQLGPEGQQHLGRIADAMHNDRQWVVIETEPVSLNVGQSYEDATLAQDTLQAERRDTVIAALIEAGHFDAADWVVFGPDRNTGIRGVEAPMVFNRQFMMGGPGNRGGMGRGGQAGGIGGGGLGGGGGFGGGGFGGGGFGGGGIF